MMTRCRALFPLLALALAACASTSASTPPSPWAAPNALHAGNKLIQWNKTALYLNPPRGGKVAVLTYWAPDGYSTYPIACEGGAAIQATKRRTFGNPKQYYHDSFLFVAKQHKGKCEFTAALNNTGSPPTAILTIYVDT
jgi:hypothetical protein